VLHASKAWALIDRRGAVLPEDVRAVLPSVAGHRLRPAASGALGADAVVAPMLKKVAIP